MDKPIEIGAKVILEVRHDRRTKGVRPGGKLLIRYHEGIVIGINPTGYKVKFGNVIKNCLAGAIRRKE